MSFNTYGKTIKHVPASACWQWEVFGYLTKPSSDIEVSGFTKTRREARQAIKDTLEKLNK